MALTSVALPSVREQLALLEARKLQYQRAALQAKRGQDLEQAKAHLRLAKCLEAQIVQIRAGQSVDLSKVSPTWLSRRTSQAEEVGGRLDSRAVNKAAAWMPLSIAISHTFPERSSGQPERWDLDRMW